MAATRPAKQGNEPGYPIGSVNNALRLLLAFRENPRIRLSDASVYLDVAHSTAHRLLAMLAYHGFVRQEESTKAYVAGPALVEVGLAVVNRMDIRTVARPILLDLKERFGETVHLVVLEGNMVRYLDGIESDYALRVAGRLGTTLPAHCTSVGKALLAEFDADTLKRLYPKDSALKPMTPKSITTLSRLHKELAGVRERGYATNRSESEDDVSSVAAVVRDPGGLARASISVAAPTSRMNAKRVAEIGTYLATKMPTLDAYGG
jgi:DNA-binding IclR family transcriptional regulator